VAVSDDRGWRMRSGGRMLFVVRVLVAGAVGFGVLVLAGALVDATMAPRPALAAPTASCSPAGADGTIRCVVGERTVRLVRGDGAGGGSWPPDGWQLIRYPLLDFVDGDACVRWIRRYLAPDERDPTNDREDQFDADVATLGEGALPIDDCPAAPWQEPPDLDRVVERFLAEIVTRLPAPVLALAPAGQAITGLAAYLETGDRRLELEEQVDLDLPSGMLTAVARADGYYTVDWGDGTAPAGPFAEPGRAYPDGTVKHVYDVTGLLEIVVSDVWEFSLVVPGLPPLPLTVGLDHGPLPVMVEQYRALRVASLGMPGGP